MIVEIQGQNVPEAYAEALQKMRVFGVKEQTRNGEVYTIPDPVLMTIYDPRERVLFDPVRKANPFFHIMEFVWMLAGEKKVKFIEYFNSRMSEYADKDGTVNGAYGHRWRNHFGFDQINAVIFKLREDPETRQAVLGMWDPTFDLLAEVKDRPCNTHIYFRIDSEARLDMTVCNRSNDLIWGMLGANVVHFTLLHELIALATNYHLGKYQVFTNNLHIYTGLPNFKQIWETVPGSAHDHYDRDGLKTMTILRKSETVGALMHDCQRIVNGHKTSGKVYWIENVANPMMRIYRQRKEGNGSGIDIVRDVKARDWRFVAYEWCGTPTLELVK